MRSLVFINALFVLECGCILDGCRDSHPGRTWREGIRNGLLYCFKHKSWQLLVDMVDVDA